MKTEQLISITKECLKDLGWTQAKLAKEVGIHPITLNRLLKKPSDSKSAQDKLLDFIKNKYLLGKVVVDNHTPEAHKEQ